MKKSLTILPLKIYKKILEQNHRFIKKRIRSMLGLQYFRTSSSSISGIEAIHMIKRGNLFYRTSLPK